MADRQGRGDGPDAAFTRAVEQACSDIGFMYLRGHGVPPERIAAMRTAVIGYFARPLEAKLRDRIERDNYRGYIPLGFFSANAGGAEPDRYEGYKLHLEVAADHPIRQACDLYGPNKWPDAPGAFRRAVLDYWEACDRVASQLLAAFASILGVDRDEFLALFEHSLTNMTLLHYPPQQPGESGFGIHPHKDTDVLTVLTPDPVGGLLVRRRGSAEWLEACAPPDTLVVNIGDLMEIWSGGYLVSTPHKVVSRSGAPRYSYPYFVVPRFDTVVRPLRPPEPGFDRSPVHVGDVSREVWRTNWPDATPRDSNFDLGTLAD